VQDVEYDVARLGFSVKAFSSSIPSTREQHPIYNRKKRSIINHGLKDD